MDTEQKALALSAAMSLVLGVSALVVGLISRSDAVLLDAAFNLSFFVTALVTHYVATLARRPDDATFPFGYTLFEPLINLVKGLLIVGVGFVALIHSVVAIVGGGHAISADTALIYAGIAVVVCTACLVALRHMAKKATTPLVEADIGNWTVNLAITGAMGGAFVVALIFDHVGMTTAARYVDPIFVCVMVVASASIPIRIVVMSLFALVGRAPSDDTAGEIKRLVTEALVDVPLAHVSVRAIRPGRTIYAVIHVVMAKERGDLTVLEADRLRAAIHARLIEGHDRIVADIMFTGEAAFAEPSAGADSDWLTRLEHRLT